MSEQPFGEAYGANLPGNYERFFVPAIGLPLAGDLLRVAALHPGERVLDVACGTGVVARLAAQQVGRDGHVSGVDINPGMLAVASTATPKETPIQWHTASAEVMPLQNASFDAVLCQMGLQFMPDRLAALHEIQRVMAPGGRLVLNAPGPTPALFAILRDALARVIGEKGAGFVDQVFSLNDTAEVRGLLEAAGLRDISVEAEVHSLPLSQPKDFLWGYVYSTPLAASVADLDDARRGTLEKEVVPSWQEFVKDGALMLEVRVVVASGRK